MNQTKAQDFKSLSFHLLAMFLFALACNGTELHYQDYPKGEITLPSGKKITVYIAETAKEQRLGLSKIKPEDFKDNEAMLFPADKMKVRQFWRETILYIVMILPGVIRMFSGMTMNSFGG